MDDGAGDDDGDVDVDGEAKGTPVKPFSRCSIREALVKRKMEKKGD